MEKARLQKIEKFQLRTLAKKIHSLYTNWKDNINHLQTIQSEQSSVGNSSTILYETQWDDATLMSHLDSQRSQTFLESESQASNSSKSSILWTPAVVRYHLPNHVRSNRDVDVSMFKLAIQR
jgi:hypothetical protein